MTQSIARILVPVDFSAHSERALDFATTIAARFGARVELLHVVEDPFMTGAWSSEVYVPNVGELLDNVTADARRRVGELQATIARDGVQADTAVVTGLPAHTIVEHAAKGGFDLIVMGTHGRSGLSHVFMGSVAERVLRKAPCPVLTVRPPAAAHKGSSTGTPAAA
jgi:nucleotide-binding universal stress UspA family protein